MKNLKLTLSLFLICLVFATCKKDKGMPTVTDVDGNVYHTVKIGTQTWMVENLKTTKFNDGSPITPITDNTAWVNTLGPAYCYYNNDATKKTPYGALYNWQAVNTGKLAPKGWHVPSKVEFETLFNTIGGDVSTAHKLKELGNSHWPIFNVSATDDYGFALMPSGFRSPIGNFVSINQTSYVWSSTSISAGSSTALHVDHNGDDLELPGYSQINGFSVRCVKD